MAAAKRNNDKINTYSNFPSNPLFSGPPTSDATQQAEASHTAYLIEGFNTDMRVETLYMQIDQALQQAYPPLDSDYAFTKTVLPTEVRVDQNGEAYAIEIVLQKNGKTGATVVVDRQAKRVEIRAIIESVTPHARINLVPEEVKFQTRLLATLTQALANGMMVKVKSPYQLYLLCMIEAARIEELKLTLTEKQKQAEQEFLEKQRQKASEFWTKPLAEPEADENSDTKLDR